MASAAGTLRRRTYTAGESEPLALQLEGELPAWPADWPALPAPLSESSAAFGFSLRYEGAADLSGPLQLQLRREQARLEASFATPALLAWLDDGAAAPLPPMAADFRADALVVEGVTLEGVQVELVEDEAPDAAADAAPSEGDEGP